MAGSSRSWAQEKIHVGKKGRYHPGGYWFKQWGKKNCRGKFIPAYSRIKPPISLGGSNSQNGKRLLNFNSWAPHANWKRKKGFLKKKKVRCRSNIMVLQKKKDVGLFWGGGG